MGIFIFITYAPLSAQIFSGLAEIDKANSSLFSIRKPDGTLRVSPKDAEMSRNAALKSFLFKKEKTSRALKNPV